MRFTTAAYVSAACTVPLVLAATQLSIPSSSTSKTTVYPNFLGISFELSFVGNYFGNSTDAIPAPFLVYLSNLAASSPSTPLRLRIGGNSMDDSTYIPSQSSPLLNFTNPQANANDQPVTFGPPLFQLFSKVAGSVGGGAKYLIGLSLRDPNDTNVPLLAGAAQSGLGDYMDAFLLGNEPDLYTSHGQRPNLPNYTVNDYIGDYWVATENLQNTSAGNILSNHNIAGPTICCDWDLGAVLTSGWQSDFLDDLKYITLQHYPQNNCFGKYQYQLDYYLNHTNGASRPSPLPRRNFPVRLFSVLPLTYPTLSFTVKSLASWQSSGINAAQKPVVMSEFNSASCGGIPGISDTFGAAMWTADYALQMASVGYSAAYLHTREPGISYNLFEAPSNSSGGWTTMPPYYSLLLVSAALGLNDTGANGTRVQDLDVQGDGSQAGYAVYDAAGGAGALSLVLFNYQNASGAQSQFQVPQNAFRAGAENVTVKILAAPDVAEAYRITWGNETLYGVGDGKFVAAGAGVGGEMSVDCSGSGGCVVSVPGPGVAVVYPGEVLTGTGGSRKSAAEMVRVRSAWWAGAVGAAVGLVALV
ncbi:glycoside hydrolase family 79 protein [Neolentinus lepideus HHB14362 ss-1]|uniref:Glycoside hydrolase family 79 protein n=1 Tax=Neolentinus lepideus HHB14362 ss-1 TaxID=1314782 RepID=A0A165V8V8_9AGAM|nr:glycoside hydrolase family 79 protein [Neolentinus lepideus HHB14362 ss-1]